MVIQIPSQLQDAKFKFCRVQKGTKRPFEKEWTSRGYSYEEMQSFLNNENYGVICGFNNLIVIDFDNEIIQQEILDKLPETLTIKTGSGMYHKYFFSNDNKSFKIFDENLNTLIDIQGEGRMVVGAGSVHPNGNQYEVVFESPIAFIDYSELQAILLPYDKKNKKLIEVKEPSKFNKDFINLLKSKYTIEEVFQDMGIDISKNPTKCPFHESKGGKCLSYHDGVWNCFHCEEKGDMITIVEKIKNISFPQALEYLAEKKNLLPQLEESKKKYIESLNEDDLPIEKEINKLTPAKLRLPENMKRILKEISKFEDEFIIDYLISGIAFKVKINKIKLYNEFNNVKIDLSQRQIINVFEESSKDIDMGYDFAMSPFVTNNMFLIVGGKGGNFKSMFLLSLGISLAQGKSFINKFMPTKKYKVLYYDLENLPRETIKRAKYIMNGLSIIDNKDGCLNLLNEFDTKNLKKEIEIAKEYDVILLDSYRRFLKGNENDSEFTNDFFSNFIKPLHNMGKIIIVLHHLKKFKLEDVESGSIDDALRGSSDIAMQPDLNLFVMKNKQIRNDETKTDTIQLDIHFGKNRLGLPVHDFAMEVKKIDSISTTLNYKEKISSEILTPKEYTKQELIAFIKNTNDCKRENIDNFNVTTLGVSKDTITRYLRELLKEKVIKKQTYGHYEINNDV